MEPAGLIRNYSSFELVGHFSPGISGLSRESRHRSCKNRNLIPSSGTQKGKSVETSDVRSGCSPMLAGLDRSLRSFLCSDLRVAGKVFDME